MKYFAIAFLIICVCSCHYSMCSEPAISLKFNAQMLYLRFAVNTYENGSNFTKLLISDTDAVSFDNGKFVAKKLNTLRAGADYVVEVVVWKKQYKVSNIHFDGKVKVKENGWFTDNDTRCTRDLYYTVNGEEKHLQGAVYTNGNVPAASAEILIEP